MDEGDENSNGGCLATVRDTQESKESGLGMLRLDHTHLYTRGAGITRPPRFAWQLWSMDSKGQSRIMS